jgi:hypothetical protein
MKYLLQGDKQQSINQSNISVICNPTVHYFTTVKFIYKKSSKGFKNNKYKMYQICCTQNLLIGLKINFSIIKGTINTFGFK